ncbi:MAG: hypothetical protein ABI333_12540 [bacterium]
MLKTSPTGPVATLSLLLALGSVACRLTVPGAGGDAGQDAGPGVDAAVVRDSGADAAEPWDSHVDAGPDAGLDAGPDAGPDAGFSCTPSGPLDCSPGSGTGTGNQCWDGTSCYLSNVQNAITGTINAYPQWFDYNNPNGCPFILDVPAFMDEVVSRLTNMGRCAIRDPNAPNEEVTVKHDNDFSENFDIVASTGCARYGGGIYTSTCAPAWW